MGETMCRGAINGSRPITTDSLLGLADAHFGVAITNATAAADTATLDLALLGRARERLDRGQAANAAIDAAKIPMGFLKVATYDATSTRRENRLWAVMWRDLLYSVDMPFQNFMTEGKPDPRVAVTEQFAAPGKPLTGSDGFTAMWSADKYPSVGTPIPIAHYTEAQLIIAEADNDAGNSGGAITIINTLHTANGLPPYSGATDKTSVQLAIIHERAAELFLEGHRLADLIRYGQTLIPLAPPAGTPYPKGGAYGAQLCFPLPVIENGT